jgi:hypothetical protein
MYSDLVMRTEVPFSYCTWKTKIPLKIIKKTPSRILGNV